MPELVQWMLGRPECQHEVDRGRYEDAFLEDVLAVMGFDNHGHPEDGKLPPGWSHDVENCVYSNDEFTIRPYWWGDCTCGWDDVESQFTEGHGPDCYQTKLGVLRGQYGTSRHADKQYGRARSKLCREMGLDRLNGCEVHCTCDISERFVAFFAPIWEGPPTHRQDCRPCMPNFESKSLGLEIRCYKYFMRGSTSNIPFSYKLVNGLVELAEKYAVRVDK